jgi:acyl-CoA thioester hydrolase
MSVPQTNSQSAQEKKSKPYTTQVRVIYADTDKMGVVYHAKYLEYFEIARNELLREIGFPYKYLEERGVFLPLIEANIKYVRPAQYDDLLTIQTIIAQDPQKFLRFRISCEIYLAGQLITSGQTVHVISSAQGRPCKPPKDLHHDLFEALFYSHKKQL